MRLPILINHDFRYGRLPQTRNTSNKKKPVSSTGTGFDAQQTNENDEVYWTTICRAATPWSNCMRTK